MAGADACIIAGIDEAGRGPLAGPVTAACVVLGQDFDVMGIDDSKKISERRREELFGQITSKALAYGVGMADNNVIDQINILNATKQAMKEAVISASDMLEQRTGKKIGLLLIDAVALEDIKIPQQAIIKGDAKSLSIAAASIIAKVTRDRFMLGCHQQYPQYGFDKNKGYGTKSHYESDSTKRHNANPQENFPEEYIVKHFILSRRHIWNLKVTFRSLRRPYPSL